jgi:hypothetical protein
MIGLSKTTAVRTSNPTTWAQFGNFNESWQFEGKIKTYQK